MSIEHQLEKVSVKEVQWERKLLDMSLRNMLINMRLTKSIVPLLSASVSALEDALAEGEEFQVLAYPEKWDMTQGKTYTLETANELGNFAEMIAQESKQKKLYTVYSEKELNTVLTRLYRFAKTSVEEKGANTLYLALGLLRWYEKKTSNTARYAPLIMIPIEITRKSAGKRYGLRMRDEEPQFNVTLLEFLKQNHGVNIEGIYPLPMDEHGLDMKKIFTCVRRAVKDEPMWDVIESGFIGNFSFAQFVMWKDIHESGEMLYGNKIVRSLMEGIVDWDITMPEEVETEVPLLPVAVDASQMKAVNMAAGDVSIVLEGPPGTGKSQTITAMIAHALAKGKKILFVAEKKAALEVVQKRLDALGISAFCLELHSNKASKKSVLEQLRKRLEIETQELDTEYANKIEEFKKVCTDINVYAQKLHEKNVCGKSLRELIDIFELIPECGEEIAFEGSYAGELTQAEFEQHKYILERLIAAGRAIGHPKDHPLSEVKQTVYTQSLRIRLKEAVTEYRETLENYEETARKLAQMLERSEPFTEKEWLDLSKAASGVLLFQEIPQSLLDAQILEEELESVYEYLQFKEEIEAKRETFERIVGKGKNLVVMAADLLCKREYEEMDRMKEGMTQFWREAVEKYPDEQSMKGFEKKLRTQISVVKPLAITISELVSEREYAPCCETAERLLDIYEAMCKAESKVQELLRIEFARTEENWMASRKASCENILSNMSSLKDWIVYRQFEEECKVAGLEKVCEAYEKGISHERLIDVYLRSIYKAIIFNIIESEPTLNCFTGIRFQENIRQLKRMDEELMELTREELYGKLTRSLEEHEDSAIINKELNTLRRAIANNARGISIRSLLDQIPNVLTLLFPCMLMSPISVAQYLEAENDLFDLVIFDEASQIPTCKAVGVLARGKNAVIVGDPNQMPPTTFFAGNALDEENLDIEDLDSILDDCLALGMPKTQLRWHYRSQHESLISFSNQEFYENKMFTFPSVNDAERHVRLQRVDGYFDRGKSRVNEAEAKSIVEEILRRYEEDPEKSIGVVTFNINQQVLIEDLIQAECQKDADFDQWVNGTDEPVFVKNLENVQGDERDVILFSVAFGPDAQGNLTMNFGPINKEGGWKRLNVAVTRARREMVVFTIMTADMIDLKRSSAKGVESLKNFLEFAERGRMPEYKISVGKTKETGIMERVCKELDELNYTYKKNIGCSAFKIDIAVMDPKHPERYILGILFDGDSYKQSKNTKDREITQLEVLERLGWKLHRIWTMDWWDDSEKELTRLKEALEK